MVRPARNRRRFLDGDRLRVVSHSWEGSLDCVGKRESRGRRARTLLSLSGLSLSPLSLFEVVDFGRGATRAEDAEGTPTQSHTSLSLLVNEDKRRNPHHAFFDPGPSEVKTGNGFDSD